MAIPKDKIAEPVLRLSLRLLRDFIPRNDRRRIPLLAMTWLHFTFYLCNFFKVFISPTREAEDNNLFLG